MLSTVLDAIWSEPPLLASYGAMLAGIAVNTVILYGVLSLLARLIRRLRSGAM